MNALSPFRPAVESCVGSVPPYSQVPESAGCSLGWGACCIGIWGSGDAASGGGSQPGFVAPDVNPVGVGVGGCPHPQVRCDCSGTACGALLPGNTTGPVVLGDSLRAGGAANAGAGCGAGNGCGVGTGLGAGCGGIGTGAGAGCGVGGACGIGSGDGCGVGAGIATGCDVGKGCATGTGTLADELTGETTGCGIGSGC